MPIYEYRCQKCGHQLEKLQRMSDAPLKDCPECGKPQLKRLVSAAGFRLKGGGWYETDFKDSNRRNVVESESKKESGAGGSDDTAAKPKPAAESGDKPAAKDASGSKAASAKSESGSGGKTGAKAGNEAGKKSGGKPQGSAAN